MALHSISFICGNKSYHKDFFVCHVVLLDVKIKGEVSKKNCPSFRRNVDEINTQGSGQLFQSAKMFYNWVNITYGREAEQKRTDAPKWQLPPSYRWVPTPVSEWGHSTTSGHTSTPADPMGSRRINWLTSQIVKITNCYGFKLLSFEVFGIQQ